MGKHQCNLVLQKNTYAGVNRHGEDYGYNNARQSRDNEHIAGNDYGTHRSKRDQGRRNEMKSKLEPHIVPQAHPQDKVQRNFSGNRSDHGTVLREDGNQSGIQSDVNDDAEGIGNELESLVPRCDSGLVDDIPDALSKYEKREKPQGQRSGGEGVAEQRHNHLRRQDEDAEAHGERYEDVQVHRLLHEPGELLRVVLELVAQARKIDVRDCDAERLGNLLSVICVGIICDDRARAKGAHHSHVNLRVEAEEYVSAS